MHQAQHRARFSTVIFAAILAATASCPTLAQTWPARSVRVVVPFEPGGSSDIVGRQVASRLQRIRQLLREAARPGVRLTWEDQDRVLTARVAAPAEHAGELVGRAVRLSGGLWCARPTYGGDRPGLTRAAAIRYIEAAAIEWFETTTEKRAS